MMTMLLAASSSSRYTHTHTPRTASQSTRARSHPHARTHARTDTHTHTHTHTHGHTHTHTHTHTHLLSLRDIERVLEQRVRLVALLALLALLPLGHRCLSLRHLRARALSVSVSLSFSLSQRDAPGPIEDCAISRPFFLSRLSGGTPQGKRTICPPTYTHSVRMPSLSLPPCVCARMRVRMRMRATPSTAPSRACSPPMHVPRGHGRHDRWESVSQSSHKSSQRSRTAERRRSGRSLTHCKTAKDSGQRCRDSRDWLGRYRLVLTELFPASILADFASRQSQP